MVAAAMSESPPVPASHAWTLGLAAMGVPAALFWDFSWESTVGVDLPFNPPHTALYVVVALAAAVAAKLLATGSRSPRSEGDLAATKIGPMVVLWGAAAFVVAAFFDRWWQGLYGLAAGNWHPPQLLKAVSLVAVGGGAWLCAQGRPGPAALAAGSLLAFASVALLPNLLANRQHGAVFYQLSCTIFPGILALAAVGARGAAVRAALAAFGLGLLAVWLLPLLPGSPQVAPVYQPRDTLLPPPFPLLLFVPALALDFVLRPGGGKWRSAALGGLLFFGLFYAVQWRFAVFLLSPAADGWLFAGGGRHWPFFLQIDETSRTSFWQQPGDELPGVVLLRCALLAILSTRLGLWLGSGREGGAA